jgi:hypothetical protein
MRFFRPVEGTCVLTCRVAPAMDNAIRKIKYALRRQIQPAARTARKFKS